VALKVHQTYAIRIKWPPKTIEAATGGHVKKLFHRAGAIAAIVGPALPGWRCLLAGALAPAVLALWSSGAMAASSDCVGAATGTSAVTNTPSFLYLQCYKPIQIPGNPLQTFGGSALIRTTATTASYYLADRSNLGVDVVNAQLFKFTKTMTPLASSPFIGQLIWAAGPLTNPVDRRRRPVGHCGRIPFRAQWNGGLYGCRGVQLAVRRRRGLQCNVLARSSCASPRRWRRTKDGVNCSLAELQSPLVGDSHVYF
jgi:hypothetical protein